MVHLTTDLLLRCASSYVKKQRDESRKHFFFRLTHLHLEGRGIDKINDDDLSLCQNLVVLYLYDNLLSSVPSLKQNALITHLYLQNNNITSLENLSPLTRLTKLYVGGNSIVVVEGLQELNQLQELHVENQKLSSGEKLLFDARSLQALAGSLLVLNVSGNGLSSLTELECLSRLTQLVATDNKLSDEHQLVTSLVVWRSLHRLDIANNPLCQHSKYRDAIIMVSDSLETLDGVEVTDSARQFLRKWQTNKEAVKQKRTQITADKYNGGDVPDAYQFIQESYIMPALNHQGFQKVLARSRSEQIVRTSTSLVDPKKGTSSSSALKGVSSSEEEMLRHLSPLSISNEENTLETNVISEN